MRRKWDENITGTAPNLWGRAALIACAALATCLTATAQLKLNIGKDSPLRKLQVAELAISNLYVDSVDEQKLVADGIRGMLEKLDPHSSYSTPKETKAMNEPLNGSFDGIGVQFNMIEDTLMVVQPVVKGPSEKVGILAGDRIVAVNDTAIAGVKMPREDIMKRLRGPRGTQVRLDVVRRGVDGKLHFVVTRDKIPVKTLDAAYMIRPKTGYIRLSSFGATSAKEVRTAIDSLKKKGMRDLIFDLQDNGGGYLEAAFDIANEFLQKNDLVVYTEGRTQQRRDYRAQGDGAMRQGRVVVLVNEFSASAAEIVTGAIQDQDRGTVVGRRTFGKGLVQRPIPFSDGSMIRLTVAHYYTPSGRCIQKPYKKGELTEYQMDLDNRYKHGEFIHKDSIHLDSTKCFYTLREHRLVYGGGGIMPDVFVPLDTLQYTRLHRQLAAKSIVINSVLHYIDKNRKALNGKYASFDDFNRNYQVPQAMTDSIFSEGERQNIKPKDDEERKRTLPYLQCQLKALIARDLWDMNEYFEVMNPTSAVVRKALEVLGNK